MAPTRAMTKSAVQLAQEALAVGQRALPRYSGPRSRHDYTQPQLFALLVVKQMLRLDYRGITTLVAEWGELRRALGLRRGKVPHYSTLCYAAHRLLAGAEKGGPSPLRSGSSSREPARGGSSRPVVPRPPSTRPGSRRTTSARTTPTATRPATRRPTPSSTAAGRRTGATTGRSIRS
jgi:hypothetical protein